jgi:hypothetical protein
MTVTCWLDVPPWTDRGPIVPLLWTDWRPVLLPGLWEAAGVVFESGSPLCFGRAVPPGEWVPPARFDIRRRLVRF